MTVNSDSDWAGEAGTKKSTTCVVERFGRHVLDTVSVTQGSVALSSGEAEFYAAIKGAAEFVGIQSLLSDMGMET